MSDHSVVIELRDICKSFGSIKANDKVNLTVRKGEILALLGENGSGKTTLMNILSGIYYPDSGSVHVNGREVTIASPQDAYRYRIGMIHQHFKLVEAFTAAENIVMGTRQSGRYSRKELHTKIAELSERFGLQVDPHQRVCDMSVSQKQTVEILKVLYRGADILILDEPTAVLTPQETEVLFDILRRMRNEGCAIILITHKLNELMAVSDRVTVLRKGKTICSVDTATASISQLTELMVGAAVELEIDRPQAQVVEHVLEIHHLTVRDAAGHKALKDVNLCINGGEILGVAGVAGSGQKELCEAIAGLIPAEEGAILHNKVNLIGKKPDEIIRLGVSMSFIPEDRLGMGLVPSMDITHNLLLKSYQNGRPVFLDRKPAKKLGEELIEELGIVTPGVGTPVRQLSGGNVQKVLLGRELHQSPNLLITAYPVRGLDINSSHLIYRLLNEQKCKGVAVLYIGEDLDVLLELCDRIAVMCHGEIVGVVDAATATKEQLGLMMVGIGETKGGDAV